MFHPDISGNSFKYNPTPRLLGIILDEKIKFDKKLDAIQRKGLSICLGLPATSGREAMEVEGNILPVDLRIEEIAVREIAKIQSKNIAEPVKQQLEEYLSRDDIYEQQESPFGKAINQTVDMFKATKVDIKLILIEPEVTYKAGVYVMMMRAPSY